MGMFLTSFRRMDNLSFREAFLDLGGTYEKETFRDRMARYHAQKERDMRRKRAEDFRVRRKLNNDLIDIYREWYQKSGTILGCMDVTATMRCNISCTCMKY